MKSLQEQFIESRGAPLHLNGVEIVQMDRIPIAHGKVLIRAKAARENQGIALKAPAGSIMLSDSRLATLVHIWFDPGLPLEAIHEFDSGAGELRVWNIFRSIHPNGAVTEDAWIGNAGMVIVEHLPLRRRYHCSPGNAASFDPQLEVSIDILSEN